MTRFRSFTGLLRYWRAYRDSRTGRFVSKEQAKANPDTTERQEGWAPVEDDRQPVPGVYGPDQGEKR